MDSVTSNCEPHLWVLASKDSWKVEDISVLPMTCRPTWCLLEHGVYNGEASHRCGIYKCFRRRSAAFLSWSSTSDGPDKPPAWAPGPPGVNENGWENGGKVADGWSMFIYGLMVDMMNEWIFMGLINQLITGGHHHVSLMKVVDGSFDDFWWRLVQYKVLLLQYVVKKCSISW